jgi:hypothetical protein
MTVQSSLGTTIGLVLGEPTSYDTTGFDALTMIELGEVADLGEFGGESEIITHTPIKTGIVNKLIGPTDYGTLSAQMARVFTDAGQIAAKSGFDGTNRGKRHSFKVTYVDGGIEYFTGKITSFTSNVGSASAVRNAGVNIALDNKVIVKDPS